LSLAVSVVAQMKWVVDFNSFNPHQEFAAVASTLPPTAYVKRLNNFLGNMGQWQSML